MLHVTQDALELCGAMVRQLATQANIKCLRLVEREGGMAMSFELPQGDDEVVQDRGNAVLAIPEGFMDGRSDLTLDVEDDGRFILS
ncbi:MAG: hypothetical protein HKN70_01720 [Gammaproteobacteria bacterium]|nr:hypothetical protein [Gammaproteobacteria bacterium]